MARSGAVSELARRTETSREGLDKALSAGGNPSFATIVEVAGALGLKIRFEWYGGPPHRPSWTSSGRLAERGGRGPDVGRPMVAADGSWGRSSRSEPCGRRAGASAPGPQIRAFGVPLPPARFGRSRRFRRGGRGWCARVWAAWAAAGDRVGRGAGCGPVRGWAWCWVLVLVAPAGAAPSWPGPGGVGGLRVDPFAGFATVAGQSPASVFGQPPAGAGLAGAGESWVRWDLGDGRFQSEFSPGVVRVETGSGWGAVEESLAPGGGGWSPSRIGADVRFSGGGERTAVSMATDGVVSRLVWDGPDVLPVPVVDGAVATYRDLLPGVDLMLRAGPVSVQTRTDDEITLGELRGRIDGYIRFYNTSRSSPRSTTTARSSLRLHQPRPPRPHNQCLLLLGNPMSRTGVLSVVDSADGGVSRVADGSRGAGGHGDGRVGTMTASSAG